MPLIINFYLFDQCALGLNFADISKERVGKNNPFNEHFMTVLNGKKIVNNDSAALVKW